MNYSSTKAYWNTVFKNINFKPLKEISTNIEPIDNAIEWLSIGSDCILDFGCGSGKLLLMASKKASGKLYGIDISKEAVRFSERLFSHYNINNYKFEVGSIEKLKQIKTNSFDGIILSNVIDNLAPKDGKLLLEEITRLLRPKGKIFLKLNDYYDNRLVKEQKLKLIKTDFYLDSEGLYLWNLPTDKWKELLEPKFIINDYNRFYIEFAKQYNRLFLLEKK